MHSNKKLIRRSSFIAAAVVSLSFANAGNAATIQITEWMYNGSTPTTNLGEFVEFTNLGSTAVSMVGWSFDDNSRTPNSQSLSAFGSINPGESVIFTDATAADFRGAWNLSAIVKIIGGNTNNLGRSDEINLYDSTGALVDRLTYNDQGSAPVNGPRTVGVSARALSAAALGANAANQWTISSVGDVEGSYQSVAFGALAAGDIGSPGKTSYAVAPVPLPAAAYLFVSGLGLLGGAVRRNRDALAKRLRNRSLVIL